MTHTIICLDEVDSTNNVIKQMAEEGAPDGLVVRAELQTAGRGRLERRWVAEKGENATFSILIRKGVDGLVFRAALAAARAVKALTGADTLVKWPNDIVLNGKKIAGILCECAMSEGEIEYMVVGVGVNLNTQHYPADLPYAGSVLMETGIRLSADAFVNEFLSHFDESLDLTLETVLSEISRISATLGRRVRAGDVTGIAEHFEPDGSLVIHSEKGYHTIVVGDVSVRGLYGYVD